MVDEVDGHDLLRRLGRTLLGKELGPGLVEGALQFHKFTIVAKSASPPFKEEMNRRSVRCDINPSEW